MSIVHRQSQQQAQKQLLKITPQQIQFLNLLQVAAFELDQRVKDEVEENPLLEEMPEPEPEPLDHAEPAEPAVHATPDLPGEEPDLSHDPFAEAFSRLHDGSEDADAYDGFSGADDDNDRLERPSVQMQTFRENLHEQLLHLPVERQTAGLAAYIIDALDDDGYLRHPLADMADDISFSINLFIEEPQLEAALHVVQQLEPPGVGARSLEECLNLQMTRKYGQSDCAVAAAARQIIARHLHDLAGHQYDKIMRVSGLDSETLRAAVARITGLHPKPISVLESSPLAASVANPDRIFPEFQVTARDGKLEVELLNQRSYKLHLNRRLLEMLEAAEKAPRPDREQKAVAQYLRSKLGSAQWFIDALKQREDTMSRTIHTIVEVQRAYFLSGDIKKLRPMILKDIAERVGLDISTISRVTSARFVQTDFGIIPLRGLFTEGMLRTNGEVVSNREVQDLLRTFVENEDKNEPLTDQQLAAQLAQQGYPIARRTVAKYRDLMGIATTQQRRNWRQ